MPGYTPIPKGCREITGRVIKTNSWTCRACFNLRINFNLNRIRQTYNWDRTVFLSFTEEVAVVKFAGPASSITFDGRDANLNYRYKVQFIIGHEFGDNRVDFNAGLNCRTRVDFNTTNTGEIFWFCVNKSLKKTT